MSAEHRIDRFIAARRAARRRTAHLPDGHRLTQTRRDAATESEADIRNSGIRIRIRIRSRLMNGRTLANEWVNRQWIESDNRTTRALELSPFAAGRLTLSLNYWFGAFISYHNAS